MGQGILEGNVTWWYENEEEEMKLYKNEDLCIGCKNDFFSKPWDHRDPTPGTIGYCIKCDNFLIKEKKMEFDRTRVYTALNADELKAGDKVIVGCSLLELKANVECNRRCGNIVEIGGECSNRRFAVDDVDGRGETYWELAYLVERAENCTNCEGCVACIKPDKTFGCEDWKPKNKKEIDMDNWNYLNYFGCSLPEKQEMGTSDRVVVAIKGYNTVDVGYYDYDLEAWFVDGNRYPVPVYAWMEVKPPKEEA